MCCATRHQKYYLELQGPSSELTARCWREVLTLELPQPDTGDPALNRQLIALFYVRPFGEPPPTTAWQELGLAAISPAPMSHWEEAAATAKAEADTSSNDGGLLCARVTVSALFDLESIWLFRRRHNSPGLAYSGVMGDKVTELHFTITPPQPERRESKGGNVPSESQVVDRNGQPMAFEFLQESQPGLGLAHMTHGPESGSSLERRHGFVGQRSPHFVEVSAVTKEPDGQTPNQIKVSNA
ncbi:uncharacterized protein ACA1_355730 [Acanthamoeba castellanii str. Neff]|uniref:Uncharacterized protein n=1 Tax=Acanthamoeba castellanii (strain ATCC 30010 / Neff) TaxID=1257118 RepID=L8H7L4_ACACF|nr:uncharacterized protein ACA1_355730 [Acanthamoeba castellanii str. Neff]ELR21227.1 hypothetical protein ACA1_355730 [Acanthamoeba castellanii str. Neff]